MWNTKDEIEKWNAARGEFVARKMFHHLHNGFNVLKGFPAGVIFAGGRLMLFMFRGRNLGASSGGALFLPGSVAKGHLLPFNKANPLCNKTINK